MTAVLAARDTVQVPRQLPRQPGPDDWAAERVAFERNRQGLSQAELARRVTLAGVAMRQQTVQQIESGQPRRKMSAGEAVAFAQVFGITLDQLTAAPDDSATRLEQLARAIDRTRELRAGDAIGELMDLGEQAAKAWVAAGAEADGPSERSTEAARRILGLMSEAAKLFDDAGARVREAVRQLGTAAAPGEDADQ